MAEMTDGMRSLAKNIVSGYDERKRTIKELKADTMSMRWEAQRTIVAAKSSRKEAGRQMKCELEQDRKELSQHVKDMREGFQTQEKAIRDDLTEARRCWGEMQDTIRSRSR
jgi:hypothetical protein